MFITIDKQPVDPSLVTYWQMNFNQGSYGPRYEIVLQKEEAATLFTQPYQEFVDFLKSELDGFAQDERFVGIVDLGFPSLGELMNIDPDLAINGFLEYQFSHTLLPAMFPERLEGRKYSIVGLASVVMANDAIVFSGHVYEIQE